MVIENSTHPGPLEIGQSAYLNENARGRVRGFLGGEGRASAEPTFDVFTTAKAGAASVERTRGPETRFGQSNEQVPNHQADVAFWETSAVPTEVSGHD